ncbi:hypothetical protein CSKR_105174 [Clonorchis sinensis]|uniref:Uncharacterized protein n=1 Tax=Clonorchis sinensis TaxID=79923 RepID=A0A3R7GWM7_CLOSI|nr:hypothetical protein CSKR_105174 [Clonorchis sinensis]
MEKSTLFGKRWFGIRNTWPKQHSFCYWTHSSIKVPVAQNKTRLLIASVRILHTNLRIHHSDAKLANTPRALEIRALTSSVTLQLEPMQLPRYVKRSTTSSTSPWIVSGTLNDCKSTSMALHFVGAKCIPKNGMTLVSSSKNTCAFSPSKLLESSLYTPTRPEVWEYKEFIMFTNFRGIHWWESVSSRTDRLTESNVPWKSSNTRIVGRLYAWVRGSNPTSASLLPLSMLGQTCSIPALVLPSGGMTASHRKGVTAEQFFSNFPRGLSRTSKTPETINLQAVNLTFRTLLDTVLQVFLREAFS